MSFLRKEGPVIGGVVLTLAIFALAFTLFNLNWQVYLIVAGLILLILALYLIYARMNFRQQKSLEDQIKEVKATYAKEKNQARMERLDLEEYFLVWVHQIKTPITAAYMLLDQEEGPVNKSLLKQELVKIENYTSLALNYLKVTNPARDLEISRVSLNDLVKDLVKKYRGLFIHSHISLHLDIPEGTSILTDANLSSLMIEQILNNALKYTPKGGDIWLTYDEESHKLTIRDNGIGIRSEDLPRIFDKGYSGLNGRLNKKSSGIGLYLVKLVADRLKQTVTAQSTIDQGSQFSIQFFEHH